MYLEYTSEFSDCKRFLLFLYLDVFEFGKLTESNILRIEGLLRLKV